MNINDKNNMTGVSSRKLAEMFFPDTEIKKEIKDEESLISIDKARQLIGFEPNHSVKEFYP